MSCLLGGHEVCEGGIKREGGGTSEVFPLCTGGTEKV